MTLQLLRSLGVPIECPDDAAGLAALTRARRASRVVEPVLVERDASPGGHRVTLPVDRDPEAAWVEIVGEGGSSVRHRLSDLVEGPPAPPGGGRPDRGAPRAASPGAVGARLPPPAHRSGRSRGRSAVPSCSRAVSGSRAGLGALCPRPCAARRGRLGCGRLPRARGTPRLVRPARGPLRVDAPDLCHLPRRPPGGAESLSARQPSRLEQLYLDVTTLPEVGYSAEVRACLESGRTDDARASLRPLRLADPARAMAASAPCWSVPRAACFLSPGRHGALADWLAAHPEVAAYSGAFAASIDAGGDPSVERYHSYVQWMADRQLARCRGTRG